MFSLFFFFFLCCMEKTVSFFFAHFIFLLFLRIFWWPVGPIKILNVLSLAKSSWCFLAFLCFQRNGWHGAHRIPFISHDRPNLFSNISVPSHLMTFSCSRGYQNSVNSYLLCVYIYLYIIYSSYIHAHVWYLYIYT